VIGVQLCPAAIRFLHAAPNRSERHRAALVDFTSGHVQRALPSLPRQGSKRPWKLYQNYALDLVTLRCGAIDDGTMEFIRRGAERRAA
jgi:hypothetical protein